MHSGSMSLLTYPELCSATSYRTHYYIPVTPSSVFCSNDVSSTIGYYLPSSYQGNLWLLDPCGETYRDVPSCTSSSCEHKTCATNCDPQNSCVSSVSPSSRQAVTACKTTNVGSSPSCTSFTQTEGYVSDCCATTLCASEACQTLPDGSHYFGQLSYLSKSPRPLSYRRLGGLAYRSSPTLGFINSGFAPSRYALSRYQPQNYLTKHRRCLNYGPMSYRPLSYASSNFRPLSCLPSSFPPLRYLCSGCRPLHCYGSAHSVYKS